MTLNSLLSINTKSEQKAGAWAFLSYLLSESYQQSMNYLPVSDTVLSCCTMLRGFIDRKNSCRSITARIIGAAGGYRHSLSNRG